MNTTSFMPEQDLLYTILTDLKRTVREYVTAATEANCPSVRQMFTDLTNSTLRMQGDLYKLMQQQNMYTLPSPALQQDVNQTHKQNQQTQQKCQQFVNQKLGQSGHGMSHPQAFNQGQSASSSGYHLNTSGQSYM